MALAVVSASVLYHINLTHFMKSNQSLSPTLSMARNTKEGPGFKWVKDAKIKNVTNIPKENVRCRP